MLLQLQVSDFYDVNIITSMLLELAYNTLDTGSVCTVCMREKIKETFIEKWQFT